MIGGLLLISGRALAQAPTQTCVDVVTRLSDAEEFRRLVVSELDRHPTHRSVTENCESHLKVEYIEVGDSQFVTGRINTQVPHREPVGEAGLPEAISRMLRVVLHNDPVRLEGPKQRGWLGSRLHELRSGWTMFGIEAYQVSAILAGDYSGIPGIALQARREVARWHLGVRLGVAWQIGDLPSDLSLVGNVSAQMQAAWFWDAKADHSFYSTIVLGLEYQRFNGPSRFLEGRETIYTKLGFAPGLRVGAELFRTTNARMDIFTQAILPAFMAHDEENEIIDAWVPTFSFGAGMVF